MNFIIFVVIFVTLTLVSPLFLSKELILSETAFQAIFIAVTVVFLIFFFSTYLNYKP